MRKLSSAERAVFGDCAICNAEKGAPCIPVDKTGSMARMQDGAHLGRLYSTPNEVPDETDNSGAQEVELLEIDVNMDGFAGYSHYVEGLEKVKLSGPEWLPETRLMLMMATAMYMQGDFSAGATYGQMGVPNMQSLLELGGMTSEEMESVWPMICAEIDGMLLPFFRDGKMQEFRQSQDHLDFAQEMQEGGEALRGIAEGLLEHNAAGTLTAEEANLAELYAVLRDDTGAVFDAIMALDASRWPGLDKAKALLQRGVELGREWKKGLDLERGLNELQPMH